MNSKLIVVVFVAMLALASAEGEKRFEMKKNEKGKLIENNNNNDIFRNATNGSNIGCIGRDTSNLDKCHSGD
jgi:hypothetical protein